MPTRHRRRRPRAPAAGFSLLELLIVIVIIGVLSGVLFVGFGAIRRSQDQRSTRAALEVARSMFNEYINQARAGGNNLTQTSGGANTQFYLRLAPNSWPFNEKDFDQSPTTINVAALRAAGGASLDLANSLDYYNIPNRDGTTPTAQPLPMDVPLGAMLSYHQAGATDVRNNWLPDAASNAAAYQRRWQVWNTMNMIRRMRSSPEAKNMWSTLRESQIVHLGAENSREDFIIDSWGNPLLFVPGTGVRGIQYGEGQPPAGVPLGTPGSPDPSATTRKGSSMPTRATPLCWKPKACGRPTAAASG
jgi:prepilin-type N-terminal cleavage/methylation domain-containing protein